MIGLQKCLRRNHISVPNISVRLIVVRGNYRQAPISTDSVSVVSVVRGLPRPTAKIWKVKRFISFKTRAKPEQAVNMARSSSPIAPSTWLIFLCSCTHASPQTFHHSVSSILAVRISCRVTTVFVFRMQQEEWRSRWISTIGKEIFNK